MNVSLSLPYNDFIFHDCVAIILSIPLFAYILEHTVDKEQLFLSKGEVGGKLQTSEQRSLDTAA